MSDPFIERAQSAEAKLAACQGNIERVKEKYRLLLETFATREMSNGSFDIDFAKLAERLSDEHIKELARALEERGQVVKPGVPGVDAFDVKKLSIEKALEFRAVIDDHFSISGDPGKKPRIRVPA